jgi:hypothetical protein
MKRFPHKIVLTLVRLVAFYLSLKSSTPKQLCVSPNTFVPRGTQGLCLALTCIRFHKLQDFYLIFSLFFKASKLQSSILEIHYIYFFKSADNIQY